MDFFVFQFHMSEHNDNRHILVRRILDHIILLSWHIFTFSCFSFKVLLTFFFSKNALSTNNILKDTVDFTDDLTRTRGLQNNGKMCLLNRLLLFLVKIFKIKKKSLIAYNQQTNNPVAECTRKYTLSSYILD